MKAQKYTITIQNTETGKETSITVPDLDESLRKKTIGGDTSWWAFVKQSRELFEE